MEIKVEFENRTETVAFRDEEAWAFAEFLKRIGYTEYRDNAVSAYEAELMQAAGERMRRFLADTGYSPR